ncbi:MAG: KamA family radical SAM protein [Planctomycetaceae bacterium]|nr:KamA family radical SAM protein [Planctomycetaceae bacterium]
MTHVNWKNELSQAVTNVAELCRMLGLPTDSGCQSAAKEYPLFVPRSFVGQMEKGNSNDPLLLQVLPRQDEMIIVPGFSYDPLHESSSHLQNKLPDHSLNKLSNHSSCRILKKYAGRALLLVSMSCGIHCRFCFRRFFPKPNGFNKNGSNESDANESCSNNFELLLEPIRSDPTIEEVILSGGDPLLLDDSELDRLLHYIIKISHVKRLRIHSRLPIVLPKRLTPELIRIFSLPFPIYLVLHINHPNELSREFLDCRQLLHAPVILSQTVLLKGINDDVEVLYQLFDRLIDNRIVPYYLHQLDRVHGAAHFEVSQDRGCRLVEQLRHRLPGYAIPQYVQEIPGMKNKQFIVYSE